MTALGYVSAICAGCTAVTRTTREAGGAIRDCHLLPHFAHKGVPAVAMVILMHPPMEDSAADLACGLTPRQHAWHVRRGRE